MRSRQATWLVLAALASACSSTSGGDAAGDGTATTGATGGDGATTGGGDDGGTSATGDDGATDTGGDPADPCALDGDGDPGAIPAPTLTAAMLMAPASPSSPVDDGAFAMPAEATAPKHAFEGRLDLHDEADAQMDTHSAASWVEQGQLDSALPEIDVELVQCGRHLIPARRGRIVTDDPYWDLFVGPGHAWSTPHDGGMSRASVPFALAFKVENCLQNGVMTFLYDDTSVSQVRYQVTQETCHFHAFDLWGQSSATYHPGSVSDAAALRAEFGEEVERRLPVEPLTELFVDHPGVSQGGLDQGLTVAELSARGLLVDGTLYLDECRTRFGTYAYCETMALPSFSVAKTAYVSMVMMALAQELPDDPYALRVADYLPAEAAAAPGDWSAVTFEHLIDMSTGHYRYDNQGDDAMGNFYIDFALADRLENAFLFPYREPPGQRAVYLTPNYQIATAAIDAYLASIGAPITDSFEYAVEAVFRPIGLEPDSFTSLRTWEGGGQNNGTAFGGYGMTFTPQGIARTGAFLLAGGAADGEQILHPDKLRDTMFQNPADHGAPMGYDPWSYNNGMWGFPIDDYGCDGFVPVMFGVSGIAVALAPNGVVYFAFNDLQEQPVESVVEQLDAIAPLCP